MLLFPSSALLSVHSPEFAPYFPSPVIAASSFSPTPGCCAEFSHPGIFIFIFFASSLGAFQEQMFLCDDCQRSLAFHTSSPCTAPAPCVVLNYSWILFNNRSNFTLPPSHSLLNKTHTHMNASKVYPPVSHTEGGLEREKMFQP